MRINHTPPRGTRAAATLVMMLATFFLAVVGSLFFYHLDGATDARATFDEQVVSTAKAAASATYTTGDGELRIDHQRAEAKGSEVYALLRQTNRSPVKYRYIDTEYQETVTVVCLPAPDEGCGGVQVSVNDQFGGTLFTKGWFPAFEMNGESQADLVLSQ